MKLKTASLLSAGVVAVALAATANPSLASPTRPSLDSRCNPRPSAGKCYEPGAYCPKKDHGKSGIAGDGKQITCKINHGWRWEVKTAPKLQMPIPSSQTDKIAEKLLTNPLLDSLISGPGSTTALGWALQPVLGDMLIAETFNPSLWVGKSATAADGLYAAERSEWLIQLTGMNKFLSSPAGAVALKLAS